MYNFDNTFIGYYITDYSTVLNTSVPTNGQPVLFADLSSGRLWSKKFINNSSYIQEYHIEPVNQMGIPESPDDLKKELDELKKELKTLKEKKDESK